MVKPRKLQKTKPIPARERSKNRSRLSNEARFSLGTSPYPPQGGISVHFNYSNQIWFRLGTFVFTLLKGGIDFFRKKSIPPLKGVSGDVQSRLSPPKQPSFPRSADGGYAKAYRFYWDEPSDSCPLREPHSGLT